MKKLLLLTLFLFGVNAYAQFQGVQTYLQVYNPTQCTYTVQQGSYFGLNDTTHRLLTVIPQSAPNLFMVWAPFGDSTTIIDYLCFTMNSPCQCPASCVINYPMNYVDTMILFLCDTTFISVENVSDIKEIEVVNPIVSDLTLEMTNIVEVEIFDLSGKKIYDNDNPKDYEVIPYEKFGDGFNVLMVRTRNKVYINKLIK